MTKVETRFNLQCDWEGICSWWKIPAQGKREIINAVVAEIDAYRNISLWDKLFNRMPKWEPLKEIKNVQQDRGEK